MKKLFIALSAATLLCLLAFPVQAARLDGHDGMMKITSANIMAYQNSNLTGQLNHYIVAGDWYNIIGSGSGSVQLHYPITIANGKGDATETHYFNKSDWAANCDGAAGTFMEGWDQSAWYNALPRSGVTYTDNCPDNNPVLYVSNNTGYSIIKGLYNNELWCGAVKVLKPTSTPATYCYYDHSDYTDADWGWVQKSQAWSTAGLIQGTNTVYCAGSDASGNYATASYTFKYDNVAPYCTSTAVKNVTSTGYDVYVYGVADATSGVKKVMVPTWTKPDQSDLQWLAASNQGGGTWTCHVSASSFGGATKGYTSDVYIYDNANNWGKYNTNTSNLTPPAGNPSYFPTADFEATSPVLLSQTITYTDLSTSGSSSDSIDQEQWSYSSDDQSTWSSDASSPPSFFLSTGTYYVRLRVHDKNANIWSDYCVREIDVISVATKPVASFLTTSPVATNAFIKYVDQSHVDPSASSWDSIAQEEWSYSTDCGQTWSAPTGFPPLTFDLSEFPASTLYATYEVRLRVKDAGNEYSPSVWSDYCIQPIIVYRPNTPPTATFSVNTTYQAIDPTDKKVKDVATGYDSSGNVSTYLIMNDGSVKYLPNDSDVPLPVSALDGATKLAVNGQYLFAVTGSGGLVAYDTSTSTVYDQGLSGVSNVVTRGKSVYAILADGTLEIEQLSACTAPAWTIIDHSVSEVAIDSADGLAGVLHSDGSLSWFFDYNSARSNLFVMNSIASNIKDISAGSIGIYSSSTGFITGIAALDSNSHTVFYNLQYGYLHTPYYSFNTEALGNVSHIYAGQYLYMVTSDGYVYTYNNQNNSRTALNLLANDGTTQGSLGKVYGLSGIQTLSIDYLDNPYANINANYNTGYAIGTDGSVKIWGYDPETQVNLPTPNDLPYFMTSYPVGLSTDGNSVSVKMSDGSQKIFGYNTWSENGYTSATNYSSANNYANNSNMWVPTSVVVYTTAAADPNIYSLSGSSQSAFNAVVDEPYFRKVDVSDYYNCSGNGDYSRFIKDKSGEVYESYFWQECTASYGIPSTGFGGVNYVLDLKIKNPVKICAVDQWSQVILMPDGTVDALGQTAFWEMSLHRYYPTAIVDNNTDGSYTSYSGSFVNWLPVAVPEVANVKDIQTVNGKIYLLMSDGSIKQLVYNGYPNVTFSIQDTGITGASSIYFANNDLMVIMSDGSVEQYDGSTWSKLALSNIVQLAGSAHFALALDSSGNVYSWGDNSKGETGQGGVASISTPTQIQNLVKVKSIAACDYSGYALTQDYQIYSWGDNSVGQLGNGTTSQSNVPVIIPYFSYAAPIPAVFPADPISYTDYSSANDYWDSLNGKTWQWSWDDVTWTSGRPDSFTWADLEGQPYRIVYIREQVSDVGNPPYSPGLTSKWFTQRVMLADPRPTNESFKVTRYDYQQDASNYWIKTGSQLGVYSDGTFPSYFLFAPTREYVGFGKDGTYIDGTSAAQYADTSGHYKSGSDYDSYFSMVNDGASAVTDGNYISAEQFITGTKDATSFELYYDTSFVSAVSGTEYHSQTGYNNSSLWLHVDGRAPTGSAVITLAGNAASAVVSNVTDNNGSGTKILYAEIFDDSSGTKANLQTVNLTTSDIGSTWKLPATSTVGIGSMSNIEIDIYAEDNVGNVGMVGTFKNGSMTSGNLTGTLVLSSHYYENTDVTGAVNVNYTNTNPTADLAPSSGVTVQITAGSQVITKTILCPANNTSYIPFTFHTPSVPAGSSQPLTVSVQIDPDHVMPETDYADNNVSQQVTIDSAAYTEPPATTYQPDIPSTFQNISPGNYPSTSSFTWQEWRYENSALVLKTFSINVSSAMQLTPDSRIGSDKLGSDGIWTIRSGYGFGDTTTVHVTTNYDQPDLITLPQRIRIYFPEFNYDMHNNFRELEKGSQTGTASDYTVTYQFKQNPQSDILARLHFTPLWFPNGSYAVLENVRDLWTPAGQINMWGASQLNISGSVYDDWFTGLIRNQT